MTCEVHAVVRTSFALFVCLVLASPVLAQPAVRKEPLVDRVKRSIDEGVRYLRKSQQPDGSWVTDKLSLDVDFQGGGTALALLALVNCGVPADDVVVKRGLTYLRGLEPTKTYVRALQTMVLVEAGKTEDLERIQKNVDWLVETRIVTDGVLNGWGYGKGPRSVTDNSNSQYALLGLWAGKQAGVKIDRQVWQQILDYYRRCQNKDGGWPYIPLPGLARNESRLTMTTAGVCGLLIASHALNVDREIIDAAGRATNCGVYDDTGAIGRGLSWISSPARDRFNLEPPGSVFYNVYGIERVGRLTGLRFLGDHDWYREGCQFLVNIQQPDGSWVGVGLLHDRWPVISSSFSLLFLSKGRTPVLISKLVHTERFPRPADDTDWNNDRNDLAHLVDFSSKTLFKKLPLAWQNFDMMRAAVPRQGNANLTDDDLADVTSDLLQSPIVYFNGHRSPRLRFTEIEKKLLKLYVDNGGFLFAEACCGSPAFDAGFKELVKELWPEGELTDLDGNHPIWSSFHLVKPGDPYRLMGISMGCKTILVYSPQDLSCQWESNQRTTARADVAFKLGANIVAYATGMEPPRPKLTQVEVASVRDDAAKIPRGFFKVAQLKHAGDWQPAPKAMRNLMDHLRKPPTGLDVSLKTDVKTIPNNRSLIDYKFLYMHGRSEFSFKEEQLKYLRFDLETGGLLFADACCGKPGFDKAFRQFVTILFPKHKLEPVPLDDPLFSKELGGVKLDEQTIRCRTQAGGPMRSVPPMLEGIKIDNRWVLLYSKYDIGCALERHKSSDCLGYDPDSAFRIAGAAVMYLLDMHL